MLAEHQRAAVERALVLLRAFGGVLLADEVGLGKSFIAAEVMRRTGGELELIVPAALVEQWNETLAAFGVRARVLTHDSIVNARFVAMPGERLIVVDEAHAFRNPRTQRYAALARRSANARVLLVTATPVCNSLGDLAALVQLLARDDLLAAHGVPSIELAFATRDMSAVERVVGALVIRRDRSALPDALRFGELDRRVIRHPVLNARVIDELRFPLVGACAILRRFLWRRLESSEAALAESVRRQLRFYDRALACLASGRTLPKRDYRRAFAHEEDRDAFQEVLFWDLFAAPGETDPNAIREEMAKLETLLEQLRASPCEKRSLLVNLLTDEREPTLIFTGSAATARDLHEVLKHSGLVTSRERMREAVLRAFRAGRIDVVVSTDMASEGLNLQRAGLVVHYDIPWNPVKLDQRNGRAHRIGQTRASVRAVYFLPRSRETRIVETVAQKNRMRRRALASDATSPELIVPTLRPRLVRGSAFLRLREAAERAGLELPPALARRHKAGIEQLMLEMSEEFLDRARLADLIALLDSAV